MIQWIVQHLPYLVRSFSALNYGSCAVVVMENLPAHKLTSIVPMIESVGATVICLSPTLPLLILLKCGGHSLNRFCEGLLPKPQQ
jgi:putative transposase